MKKLITFCLAFGLAITLAAQAQDIEKLNINVNENNGLKKIQIDVKKKGQPMEHLEWEGTGNPPANIQQYLDGQTFLNHEAIIINETDDEQIIILKNEEGQHIQKDVRVLINDVEGEIDEEIKEMLYHIEGDNNEDRKVIIIKKDVDVDHHINEDGEEHHIKIRVDDGNGSPKVIEWEGEGDIPAEIREQMDAHGIDLDIDTEGNEMIVIAKGQAEDSDTHVKTKVIKKIVTIEVDEDQTEKLPKGVKAATDDAIQQLQLDRLDIFPNPAQGQVQVRFSAKAVPTKISMVDAGGRRIFSERLKNFDGQFDETINLKRAAAGPAFLVIEQGKHRFTEKLIIQ